MVRRHRSRPRRKPALALVLVLVGACVGLIAAMPVIDLIESVRISGPAAVAIEPGPAKPTEEDDAMAHALAAAIGVKSTGDCQSFEPRHRRGCREFLERQRRDAQQGIRPGTHPAAALNPSSPGAPSR